MTYSKEVGRLRVVTESRILKLDLCMYGQAILDMGSLGCKSSGNMNPSILKQKNLTEPSNESRKKST